MDGLMDDDYDPLAPVHVEEADEDDDIGADHTAADPARIVRVWIDEDGALERVHVSPVWHRKIGHRTLDEVFNAVLAAAKVRLAPEPDSPDEDLSGVDFSGLLRFGRDPFTTIRLALENVNRRWAEAAARQLSEPRASAAIAEAADDDITVWLDEDGHLNRVEFDPDWLDDADVREITDGVTRLAREARARYVPAPPQHDELADIAREHDILMAGMQRMLAGKGLR